MEIPDWDPDAIDPVYAQVADWVERRIRSGELRPGRRLTAERELAGEIGVAYGTVRRAMQELRDRGLIKTIQGKGTYVV